MTANTVTEELIREPKIDQRMCVMRGSKRTHNTRVPELRGAKPCIDRVEAASADEVVTITNEGQIVQPLTGWILASLRGPYFFRFPKGTILHAVDHLLIHSGPGASPSSRRDLLWCRERRWNSKGDLAVLFDMNGHEVNRHWYGQVGSIRSMRLKLLFRRQEGVFDIRDRHPDLIEGRKTTMRD
jgi:hypothetical protein